MIYSTEPYYQIVMMNKVPVDILLMVIHSHFVILKQATFYWKAGWRISLGPCSDTACTTDDIGRLGTYENPYGGKDM